VGPALCGLVIAKAGFPTAYSFDAICALVFLVLVAPIRIRQANESGNPSVGIAKGDLLSGLRFVFSAKLVLATITLDLFAVLLGGATALLPMFADRLHVGAVGLGWMRAADALGAIAMSLLIAHLPPKRFPHTDSRGAPISQNVQRPRLQAKIRHCPVTTIMSTKSLPLHVGVVPTLPLTAHPQKFHPKEHPFCMRATLILGSFILTRLANYSGSEASAGLPRTQPLPSNPVDNRAPP